MPKKPTLFQTVENSEALRLEARYLYGRLFHREPSADLIDAYLRVHGDIPELRAIDSEQRRTMNIIVTHQLDALGMEPWLRGGRRRHALSSKLLLLAYLAECDATHPEFVRSSTDGSYALLRMGLTTIAGLFGLLRGRFQKGRYGLL